MGREWYFGWGSKSSSKKAGGTTKEGGGGGGGGGRGGNEKKSVIRPQVATAAAAAAAVASGGCMNSVLHMFDFHLCLHPHNSSYLQDDPTPLKGVEAPRNSLESITEEDERRDYTLNNIRREIQVKTNRRDTGLKLVQAPRGRVDDTLSESSSCSPAGTGARTPTLVARLMGLDILPESTNTTPRSSSCNSHMSSHSPHITSSTPPGNRARKTRTKSSYNNDVPGPRSQPETPKASPSRRKRSTSNVVEDHRLSLQINKENSIVKEMESSRPSCSAINTKRREGRKYDEENKSPGYYARQIMKQVRETVSRRVGADITNTISQRDVRRDEHLLSSTTPTKSKKSATTSPRLLTKISETSNRVSETSNRVSENISAVTEVLKYDVQEVGLPTSTMDKPETKPLQSENEKPVMMKNQELNMDLKGFSVTGTKSSSKMLPKSYESVRNKKDEQFVRSTTRANNASTDKKCNKKTPLSSDLVVHGVPVHSIVPLKKDSMSPQAPPKLLIENQEGSSKAQVSKLINSISTTIINTPTRLSRSPCQRTYGKLQEEATHKSAVHEKVTMDSTTTSSSTITTTITTTTTTTTTATSVAEFQYISRILKCTGIDRDTPISFTRWFSPSHPLDPTIYHNLEAAHYLFTTKNTDHCSSTSEINLSLSINRKLIFHLVDEILADILKPYIKSNPYHKYHHYHHKQQQQQQQINGFQLVKTLCTKIRSFPSADCQTLQDIDALVERDLPRFGAVSDSAAFEEEGEAIVAEIEQDIVDSLVQEMAVFCISSKRSSSMQSLCY